MAGHRPTIRIVILSESARCVTVLHSGGLQAKPTLRMRPFGRLAGRTGLLSRAAMDPRAILHQAIAFHQTGKLADAERLYLQAMAADPREPTAPHMLGVVR